MVIGSGIVLLTYIVANKTTPRMMDGWQKISSVCCTEECVDVRHRTDMAFFFLGGRKPDVKSHTQKIAEPIE